jgi:hypothetical protein
MLLPPATVLPAFGLWSLGAAAVVALVAGLRPWAGTARAVIAWDVVGAVALIGCAAAILGEIQTLAEYVRPTSLRNESHD